MQPLCLLIMNCAELIDLVKGRAEERWGDNWLASLVREYVAIAKRDWGDESATVARRRPQLERLFERRNCQVDTLLILLAAVDLKVKLIEEREVEL